MFREVIQGPRNVYLEEWVKSGGKVMGYYCSYLPEEIFTAGGFLPYRIRGAGIADSTEGDAYMTVRTCSFVRHTVSLALRGQLDFLDGVVLVQNCDHVRRAGDLFVKKVKVPFFSLLSVPRAPEERLYDWYLGELKRLKGEMETHFGLTITDEKLEEAIELHNVTRQLVEGLYEVRKREAPPISGEEALSVTVAAHLMPRDKFNALAGDLLAALKDAEGSTDHRARIIITGSELDSPEYVAGIEEQGALSVAEVTCFGERSFGKAIEPGSELPLERIARHRFFQTPCARMVGRFDEQVALLKERVREFGADGIIFQRMKFCDPWAGDGHNLYWRMKEEGIPFLGLDREYQASASGQVGTRVQAFLEQMDK
jgi:benzoyl-CoA reductase/2-hydroxyglutaryl-CoA dehydratase subunit BcrC/BadD/HgdB